jgi:hypothetical protein
MLPSCMAQAQLPVQGQVQLPAQGQVPGQMQEDPAIKQARMQRVEAFKIAYIIQQLNISPGEEGAFVRIYNQYQNELHYAIVDHAADEIARDEAVLNVRKKYQPQFMGVLGKARANHVFEAERQFNGFLLRQLHNRYIPQRMPPQRMPMNRKGFR